jgi:hypothetical protein
LGLSSCIATDSLLKQVKEIDSKKLNINDINGVYKNISDSSNQVTLWTFLYDSKFLQIYDDTTKQTKEAMVRLFFNNKNKLTVSLIDSNKVINQFALKVKVKTNYLDVKRKFILIPFPPILYYHNESKAILFFEENEGLRIFYNEDATIWILIGASSGKNTNAFFDKVR